MIHKHLCEYFYTHDEMFTVGAEYLAGVMAAAGKNVKFAASFILVA